MKSLLIIAALIFSGSVFANSPSAYTNKAKEVKTEAAQQVDKVKEYSKEEIEAAKEKMAKKAEEMKKLGKNAKSKTDDATGM